jgi:large subunit ribosomal protein L21
MLAIIELKGKQYKVKPGDILQVNKFTAKAGEKIKIDQVLLVNNDKEILVGTPIVKSYSVEAEVIDQVKGKKLEVRRYKSKVRERRKIGFRPQFTTVKILNINQA